MDYSHQEPHLGDNQATEEVDEKNTSANAEGVTDPKEE